jgi:hypothetical protein
MRSTTGADRLARKKTSRRSPKGPLLELGRRKAFDELRRRRDTEEVGEEGQRLLSRNIELLEPLGDAVAHILGRRGRREIEIAEQQLQDWAVRDGAAVRGARGLELEDVGPVEVVQEFVEQPRLADSRLPGQQDGRPLACRRAPEGPREHGELAVASHQRAQRALRGDLEPGSTLHLARERVGADRLALSLHLEIAEILEGEHPIPEVLGASTDDDLPGLAMLRSRAARLVVSPTAV